MNIEGQLPTREPTTITPAETPSPSETDRLTDTLSSIATRFHELTSVKNPKYDEIEHHLRPCLQLLHETLGLPPLVASEESTDAAERCSNIVKAILSLTASLSAKIPEGQSLPHLMTLLGALPDIKVKLITTLPSHTTVTNCFLDMLADHKVALNPAKNRSCMDCPLALAVSSGDLATLERLVYYFKWDPTICYDEGVNLFQIAISNYRRDIIDTLTAMGVQMPENPFRLIPPKHQFNALDLKHLYELSHHAWTERDIAHLQPHLSHSVDNSQLRHVQDAIDLDIPIYDSQVLKKLVIASLRGHFEINFDDLQRLVSLSAGTEWFDAEVLCAAIQENHEEWIARLLPLCPHHTLTPHEQTMLFQSAMNSPNISIMNTLLEQGFPMHDDPIQPVRPYSLLYLATCNCHVSAVSAILRTPASRNQLSPEDIYICYYVVTQKGDLECAQELGEAMGFSEDQIALDMLTGIARSRVRSIPTDETLAQRIAEVAYFTNLEIFHHWIDHLKDIIPMSDKRESLLHTIDQASQEVATWLPYVARYVRESDQANIEAVYRSHEEPLDTKVFVARQRAHGLRMYELVQRRLQMPFTTLSEAQDFYAFERVKNMVNPEEKTAFTQHRNLGLTTPLTDTTDLSYYYEDRYAAANYAFILDYMKSHLEQHPPEGYQVYHKTKRSPEGIPLTTVIREDKRWIWSHAHPDIARQYWDEAEHVVNKFLKLELDPTNPESVASYKKLWLKAFWLSSQLCRYRRGSAQYTLCSMAEISLRKGQHPPIPLKDFPELNTKAISVPWNLFEEIAERMLEQWTIAA